MKLLIGSTLLIFLIVSVATNSITEDDTEDYDMSHEDGQGKDSPSSPVEDTETSEDEEEDPEVLKFIEELEKKEAEENAETGGTEEDNTSRDVGRIWVQTKVQPLSETEQKQYWRTFDTCVTKMRATKDLERKLVSGDIEKLEYYDKCGILCFLYDNEIVQNGRFNTTKLANVLHNSQNAPNLDSALTKCNRDLPADCLLAYDIYKCFKDKGATIFFNTYIRPSK